MDRIWDITWRVLVAIFALVATVWPGNEVIPPGVPVQLINHFAEHPFIVTCLGAVWVVFLATVFPFTLPIYRGISTIALAVVFAVANFQLYVLGLAPDWKMWLVWLAIDAGFLIAWWALSPSLYNWYRMRNIMQTGNADGTHHAAPDANNHH